MDILALFVTYGPWSWIVSGLVLLAIEIFAPGGVFLWLGISALVTGAMTLFQPLGWPAQIGIFGVLSVLSIFTWLRFVRSREPMTDRPFLNRRAERFVGQEIVLDEPIKDGFGRVPLGDSVWRISGPDLAAGRKVRIVGHEGPVLKVEAA
ncbi:MAG TPA: NfeD family protein [Arsenicitalea sp.]|jgi:membrane protein implicated in regulation of membrane protease activity|nr:NfeD family protein [Arsenicitalea sp.]